MHCLANTGDAELRVLGVFRPAGSPAEAYYPDGTPAALPSEGAERAEDRAQRDVVWEGNVARGQGAITADSGAFSALPYTLPSRIGDPEGKTSPEELLAAATAGCLTMSVASELARDGTPPGRLEVHCKIVMDEVDGEGHQIVGAELTVRVEGAETAPTRRSSAPTRAARSRRCCARRARR